MTHEDEAASWTEIREEWPEVLSHIGRVTQFAVDLEISVQQLFGELVGSGTRARWLCPDGFTPAMEACRTMVEHERNEELKAVVLAACEIARSAYAVRNQLVHDRWVRFPSTDGEWRASRVPWAKRRSNRKPSGRTLRDFQNGEAQIRKAEVAVNLASNYVSMYGGGVPPIPEAQHAFTRQELIDGANGRFVLAEDGAIDFEVWRPPPR